MAEVTLKTSLKFATVILDFMNPAKTGQVLYLIDTMIINFLRIFLINLKIKH
jgi:hypothetical protein